MVPTEPVHQGSNESNSLVDRNDQGRQWVRRGTSRWEGEEKNTSLKSFYKTSLSLLKKESWRDHTVQYKSKQTREKSETSRRVTKTLKMIVETY